MTITRRRIRATLTDSRSWGLTCLLVGWPALGIVAQSTFVLESATPVIYVYLFALSAIVQSFPGFPMFWVGFILFCFTGATVLVSAFDWVSLRRGTSKQPDREQTVGD